MVGDGHYGANWNNEAMESEKVFRKVEQEGLGQNVVRHSLKAFTRSSLKYYLSVAVFHQSVDR